MNIDLTPILQAVIGLLAAFLTYRLIPMIKAKTDNEQRIQIAAAIRVAVFAAEQIFGAGHGKEKLDFAIRYLHDQGYDVDARDIEAAVCQYFNIDNIIHGLLTSPVDKPPEPVDNPVDNEDDVPLLSNPDADFEPEGD